MGEIHARNIVASEGAELVCCCDIDLARAAQLAEETGAHHSTSDPAAVMSDGAVDTVVIATPHHNHAELAMAAAECGKHILLEKPMAMNVEECLAIEQAVDRAGVCLMLGFKFRFAPAVLAAKEAVPHPILVIGQCLYDADDQASGWAHDPAQSGGPLIGTLVHVVDLIRFVSGSEPVRVYADGCNRRARVEEPQLSSSDRAAHGEASPGPVPAEPRLPARAPDNAVATLTLDNGVIASIVLGASATSGLLSKWCLQVVGTHANATIYDHVCRMRLHHIGERSDPPDLVDRMANSHEVGTAALLAEFMAAIRQGRPASPGPRDGTLSVLICRQLERSIETGRPEPITA